jgi:drug/metabolite transporter (DMT)-like permease
MSPAWRVRLALAITVLMWSAAFVAIRVGAKSYDAGPFLLLRFLIPALLLGVLAARTRSLAPPASDRPRVIALGFLFLGYIGLLVIGEATVDAGTASMLAETSPLLTAALAVLLFGERIGPWLAAGLAAGFAGAALIAIGESGGLDLRGGGVAILGAAFAQALLIVVQRPLLERQSATSLVAQASIVGAVAMLPFAPRLVDSIVREPASATLAIVFVAVTTGAVSYVTLAYAIARSPSTSQVSAVLYLVPPLAVLLSAVLLGEPPTALAVAGGALALVGVALSQRQSAHAPRE